MGNAVPNATEELIVFSTEWCSRKVLEGGTNGDREGWPTKYQLARLLEVLYHASFETEEGQFPKLAAMWMCRTSPIQRANVLRFGEQKELNKPNSTRPHADLLKSASICESETVFLLVEPKKKGSLDLVVWGFADIRGRDGSHGNQIRERLDISQYPDALTVHFAGPGKFSIRRNGKFTAEYPEQDSLEPVELWDLRSCFGAISENEQEDRTEAGLRAAQVAEARTYFIELVLGRLAASGRGGVLLWHGSVGSRHLYDGTRVEGVSVDEQIRELIGLNGADDFRPDAPYRFRELAQWMSEIASVDGATEITPDLKIVQYGVKISTAPDYMNEVKRVSDPDTYAWLKPRGTRHGSAQGKFLFGELLSTLCVGARWETRVVRTGVVSGGCGGGQFVREEGYCVEQDSVEGPAGQAGTLARWWSPAPRRSRVA